MLGDRFGQTGATGQILFTVTTGKITDSANAKVVGTVSTAIGKVKGVTLSNPLKADDPMISKDQPSTLGQVRFSADGAVRRDSRRRSWRRRSRRPSSDVWTRRSVATPTRTPPTPARSPSCSACWCRS